MTKPKTYGPICPGGPKDLLYPDLKDLWVVKIFGVWGVSGGMASLEKAQMKTLSPMKPLLFGFRDHARDLKTYRLDLWTYSSGWT